jgi:hypothetical protein
MQSICRFGSVRRDELRRHFAVVAQGTYIANDPRAATMPTTTPTNSKPAKLGAGEPPPAVDGPTQSKRFMKAAQQLRTDNDPERSKETVRKATNHDACAAQHGQKND